MKRAATALVLMPVILSVVFLAPGWLVLGVAAIVAVICFREYCGIAEAYQIGRLGPVGYGAGLLLLVESGQTLPLMTALALAALAVSLRLADLTKVLPRAAALVLGVLYVFGPWKFAVLLRAQSPHWLAYALLLTWAGDMLAYHVGKRIGRHKMAARVSPGKSWEGAVASMAGSLVVGYGYLAWFLPLAPPLAAVALTAAANAAGQIGDLAESALKRGAGVKDSGALLPGHGGLLDRVDSTLFTLPVVYVLMNLAR